MISPQLLALVRCPDCRGALAGNGPTLTCQGCGRAYDGSGGEYLDFRPAARFTETTKYLDDALHADARHETVSPPLLSAAIRNDMLRALLAPQPGDRVLDLGCGSGRVLLWNRGLGAYAAGIDISPHFAGEACAGVDLVLGDLRRLPFADEAFTKGYSLDVFEHLSRAALDEVLREAARVLAPGGALFVYSHVRRNSRLALGLRGINRLARVLERMGLIDMRQERLRKSDHQNPLADIPDLERTVRGAGFRIERIRYYTPIVGGFVENILMRVAERFMARRATAVSPRRGSEAPPQTAEKPYVESRSTSLPGFSHSPAAGPPARVSQRAGVPMRGAPEAEMDGLRTARTIAKRRIAQRGLTYQTLRALTVAMKLDVALFGRVRSGPFFALLRKS